MLQEVDPETTNLKSLIFDLHFFLNRSSCLFHSAELLASLQVHLHMTAPLQHAMYSFS
jgi:hypothetical protein